MVHSVRLILLGLALATPGAAFSEVSSGSADEADALFTLGVEAYKRGDFRQAVVFYLQSNRLAPNRNVVFNAAKAYEKLGQHVQAYRYYTLYAEDPATPPAEAVDAVQAMQRLQASVALLQVTTTPPGATIYIDRQDLGSYGVSPRRLPLEPRRVRVILEKEGHERVVVEGVALQRGRQSVVERALVPIAGSVQLAGAPAGAEIRQGDDTGPVLGRLPGTLTLPPGRHTLYLSAPDHRPRSVVVEVQARQALALRVVLEEQTGTLVVQSDERDALILLDGKPVGFTPGVVEEVRAGPHELRVELAGFRGSAQQVLVKPNDRLVVDARLVAADDVAAASRSTESVRDAPASVSLLSRPELTGLGASTLFDAALGTRGFYPNNDETYLSLGMRGFSSFGDYGNRLQVQLDGHTLNDDWVGSSYVGHDLLASLQPVERVELVRGPGSVLYGSNAFFGVLNLVTPAHVPRHRVRGTLGTHGDGSAFALVDGGLAAGEQTGLWAAAGGVLRQPRDRAIEGLADSDGQAPLQRGVDDMGSATLLARGWWHELSLQAYLNQRDKQIPTGAFGTVVGDHRTRVVDRRAFVEARYEPRLLEVLQLLGRVALDHAHYQGSYAYPAPDGLLRESYDGAWASAELRGALTPFAGLRATLGSDYQFHFVNSARGSDGRGDSYLDESHPFHTASGYGTADWAPWRWLKLSAGGRVDGWWITRLQLEGAEDSRLLWSFNPRLALVLRPTVDDNLKLTAGRAFRAPSVYELTYWDGGLTQVQSPDLQPETINSVELELAHRLADRTWLSSSIYLNQVEGLIVQQGAGDEVDPFSYSNRGQAVWTLGAEAELRHELRRGVLWALSYGLQRTRLGSIGGGEALPNSPEHTAGLKLLVPLARRLAVAGSRAYVELGRLDRERRWTRPVLLWDLTLSGSAPQLGLEYTLGLRNLLDWHYHLPVGSEIQATTLQQPGRQLFGSLSYAW